MILTRTIRIKLDIPSIKLMPTVRACTEAFNYICRIGYADKDFNRISLHHKTYRIVREKFGLPADTTVQMRQKAAEALRRAIKEKTKCPQSKQCSLRYSPLAFNVWFDRKEASILTLNGRIKASFYFPPYFEQYLSWRRKSAELTIRNNKVFLHIVFEKEIEDVKIGENPKIIGIDRGINKVAVCSNNVFFNGEILRIAHRYHRLRRELQKCGSKSAKRHLKRIAQKENRFRRDINHCISKQIVQFLSSGSIIVLEDLKNIRKRCKMNKKGRRKLHGWSFYQLEQFLQYKAEAKNILVDFVDARYTSQKCSKCKHTAKANRKSQAVFKCKKCGFSLNADLNAARNIELNYRDAKGYPEGLSVNQSIVGTELAKRRKTDCASA